MLEALALIVAPPILWFLFKLASAYLVSPEKTGKRFLLQEARRRGVDVSTIPDAAWDEFVDHCIKVAKVTARFDKRAANWRANLVNYLVADASGIAAVLRGEHGPTLDFARETLVRHNVALPD